MSLLTSDLSSISPDDRRQIDLTAQLIVNVTECIDLERFVPFRTEESMERAAQRYNEDNRLFAGRSQLSSN